LDIFKTLGNKNRRSIITILLKQEMHLSALARELNISVPVCLRHLIILEKSNIIEKRNVGGTHIFQIKKESMKKLHTLMDLLDEEHIIKVNKGSNLADALRKVPGIKIEKTKQGDFISSVDKSAGYFIYEVNGKLEGMSPDKIKIDKDTTVELKRLLPVVGKKISIKLI
jgi:DNA-binding transcriptional ArsR family regulator